MTHEDASSRRVARSAPAQRSSALETEASGNPATHRPPTATAARPEFEVGSFRLPAPASTSEDAARSGSICLRLDNKLQRRAVTVMRHIATASEHEFDPGGVEIDGCVLEAIRWIGKSARTA